MEISELIATNEWKNLKKVFLRQTGVEVQPDQDLISDLGLDDLDIVELIADCERTFHVTMYNPSRGDADYYKTPQQICESIINLRKENDSHRKRTSGLRKIHLF